MTLTEVRPKRSTLADLEETCRRYPEHTLARAVHLDMAAAG
jgi:hypothetical protein